MRRRLPQLLILPVAAMLLSGCFYSRDISRTRRHIEQSVPDLHLKQQVVINIGPGVLGFTGWLARFGDNTSRRVGSYIQDVDRVDVGVYEVRGNATDLSMVDLGTLPGFKRNGWQTMARIRDEGSDVRIYYRERYKRVTDLYLIVMDGEDLVIARVHGRLSPLFERIMKDHRVATELIHLR